MEIKLIAVGTRMPDWVETAFEEYRKRLPREINLRLIELTMPKRQKNTSTEQLIAKESALILNHVSSKDYVIVLDEHGKNWSSKTLAIELKNWLQHGKDICLLVGGPDGLSDDCKQRANAMWSLSALTLPHPIVRVMIPEQIYRAWSIINNHPYHRE